MTPIQELTRLIVRTVKQFGKSHDMTFLEIMRAVGYAIVSLNDAQRVYQEAKDNHCATAGLWENTEMLPPLVSAPSE